MNHHLFLGRDGIFTTGGIFVTKKNKKKHALENFPYLSVKFVCFPIKRVHCQTFQINWGLIKVRRDSSKFTDGWSTPPTFLVMLIYIMIGYVNQHLEVSINHQLTSIKVISLHLTFDLSFDPSSMGQCGKIWHRFQEAITIGRFWKEYFLLLLKASLFHNRVVPNSW